MSEASSRAEETTKRLQAFMDTHVFPNEALYEEQLAEAKTQWTQPPLMKELRAKAKAEGLWNLFLPTGDHGAGFTNLEYARMAEITGHVLWAPEVFNSNAPDSGNMEVLLHYGNDAQKERWLEPLLNGDIGSGFAMTEPDVASSDATNIQCSVVREGDEYVINGRKWFTTGAMNDRCKILILMGKTTPDGEGVNRHKQQSMILVPMDTPGVKVERPIPVLGFYDAPGGHPELSFTNVRVPVENVILGEGAGFEIAQGRLGPGRIHHCMRLIGLAQRALELMCKRAEERVTFGKKLSQRQSVREDIAKSFCEIEQARLLTLQAARRMDEVGNKLAQDLIAAIKITAPTMACTVIDRAMQIHGGRGLTNDTFLANAYAGARSLRLADGPDQVHMMQLGRNLARKYAAQNHSGAA